MFKWLWIKWRRGRGDLILPTGEVVVTSSRRSEAIDTALDIIRTAKLYSLERNKGDSLMHIHSSKLVTIEMIADFGPTLGLDPSNIAACTVAIRAWKGMEVEKLTVSSRNV